MCLGCRQRVTPPGVLAPYERGAEVTRAAKSQRERDLEALDLAGRKGVMLAQLRALADDERLDPASLLKIEWFAEQVKAAAAGGRLDELAALFGQAGIRRRRWWQGQPTPLTAAYADEDEDEDAGDGYADYAGDDGQGAMPAAGPAAPVIAVQQHRARLSPMTWADALAAVGWRISPAVDGCQVVDDFGRLCGAETAHHIGAGWVCGRHHAALCQVITDYDRARRTA